MAPSSERIGIGSHEQYLMDESKFNEVASLITDNINTLKPKFEEMQLLREKKPIELVGFIFEGKKENQLVHPIYAIAEPNGENIDNIWVAGGEDLENPYKAVLEIHTLTTPPRNDSNYGTLKVDWGGKTGSKNYHQPLQESSASNTPNNRFYVDSICAKKLQGESEYTLTLHIDPLSSYQSVIKSLTHNNPKIAVDVKNGLIRAGKLTIHQKDVRNNW